MSSNQTLTRSRGRASTVLGADAGSTEKPYEGSRTSVDLVFFNVIFMGTVYPPREFFPPRFLDDRCCYRSRLSYG
ncbi:hypothetical protein CEXT_760651, partial [Caerostris extrusa]